MKKRPVRQESIVGDLRERIVRGALAPGARLPTRLAMAEHFATTPVTVQRALASLARDGFVTSSRSYGTFVSKNPPHLSNYALVFDSHPVGPFVWGQFWQALANEAMTINRAKERRVRCYYDVNGNSDGEDQQNLLRDVSRGRVAGVIFAGAPNAVISHPVLESAAIPRVVFSSPFDPAIQTIWPDNIALVDRAMEYFAQRGRRAPAVLLRSSRSSHWQECAQLESLFQKYQMRHKPHWLQYVDTIDREAPQLVVQALLNRDQTDAPDSLFIADDTMLGFATVGLAATGRRVPEEVEVVGHSNFPWLLPTPVPVTRLGFDVSEMMRMAIDSIDRQRQGRGIVGHVAVPPRFEREIQQSAAAPSVAMRAEEGVSFKG
jgi:DNA-binding LacI/PurR family transcriptional regulator